MSRQFTIALTKPGYVGYTYRMMTRKDFEAIAHILDANVADEGIVLDFADMLAEQNPRFDRARFIDASTNVYRLNAASTIRRLDRAKAPKVR